MSNNLFAGRQNPVFGKSTLSSSGVSIDSQGFNSSNTIRIREYDGSNIKSWIPGPGIKPFTTFRPGVFYMITMSADKDAESILETPNSTGSSGPASWAQKNW